MKIKSIITESAESDDLWSATETELQKIAQTAEPGKELQAKERMVAIGLAAVVALKLKEKAPNKEALQYYMALYEKERAGVNSDQIKQIVNDYLDFGGSAESFFNDERDTGKVSQEALGNILQFTKESNDDSSWLAAVYALRQQESTPRTAVANSIKAKLGNRLEKSKKGPKSAKERRREIRKKRQEANGPDHSITVRSGNGKYTSHNGVWYNDHNEKITSPKSIRHLDDLADEQVSKRKRQ